MAQPKDSCLGVSRCGQDMSSCGSLLEDVVASMTVSHSGQFLSLCKVLTGFGIASCTVIIYMCISGCRGCIYI